MKYADLHIHSSYSDGAYTPEEIIDIAKKNGVKTGMALWQAKQVCPEIIFVPPRMDLYLRFSQMAREIYSEYTDKIEPYGIDEAWLDVSDSRNLKGSGMTIAREISHRIK